MKLIVGLGNPGKDYSNTRHNIGFSFIDSYLAYKKVDAKWISKFDGEYLQTMIEDEKVIFLKPQTYMNLSGNSVRKIMDYYHIDVNDLLVISDDLDLKVGNYKLKLYGSCGGHNGLRDIENKIGTDQYKRLKIGISNDKSLEAKDYVLEKFPLDEKKVLENLFQELYLVIDDYFSLPFGDLMSKYNRKNK